MSEISRRQWVKGMSFAILGSVAFHDLHANHIPSNREFNINVAEDEVLQIMIDAIIPPSKIPGAIKLGVPDFVKTMLKDCYEVKAQKSFQEVLGSIPTWYQQENSQDLSKAFSSEKEQFLFQMEKGKFGSDAQKTLSTLKGLTIQGFMSSEYIMVNHLNYQMAPGFYNGCVSIKK